MALLRLPIQIITFLKTINYGSNCPPQQIGHCYAGSVTISSPYNGGIINRRCAETINRDWCAVSFYTFGRTASFGCANDFAIPFGAQTCGDGPGFINQQGCRMANTPFGPCYFCCCRGGSCNHPAVFARDAASVLFPGQYPQQMFWNSARPLIDFRTAMISVYIVVCIQ